MRARVLLLLLVALAFAPAAEAGSPGRAADNPAATRWFVDFVPTAPARSVGEGVPRDGDYECASACGTSYLDVSASNPLRFQLDVPGCDATPCDMTVEPTTGRMGFRGALHWDGTTFTGKGRGAYGSGAESCLAMLPPDSDVVTFTVDGDSLSGTATVLIGWFADTANGEDRCTKLRGYELRDGTISARALGAPVAPRATVGPSGAPVAPPGAVAAGPLSGAEARRLARDVALRAHERPAIAVGIPDARSVPWRPSRVAVSALLALVLVVLMPFPAALFNSTLEANYDEVRGWFGWVPRRQAGERPVWVTFAVVVVAAALLNAFLDPRLRLDAASLETVAGLALSIAAVSLLATLPARMARGERPVVRVFPLGLVVAALCVLVSRVTSFEPGYLYGVIAGFAFTREVGREEKGRIAFTTAAFLLLAAVAAFVVRVPVHEAAADGGVPLVLLDTVLAAVFAAGVEANVLGLLPLRFLPGEDLIAWRRWAWAGAFGLSLFAFLHALAAGPGDDSATTSVTVAAVLFGAFATVSVTFWAYFRFRRHDPTPVSV